MFFREGEFTAAFDLNGEEVTASITRRVRINSSSNRRTHGNGDKKGSKAVVKGTVQIMKEKGRCPVKQVPEGRRHHEKGRCGQGGKRHT